MSWAEQPYHPCLMNSFMEHQALELRIDVALWHNAEMTCYLQGICCNQQDTFLHQITKIQRMNRSPMSARNNWVNALLSFIKNWERFCVYSCHKGGTIVHSSSNNWELWWSSLVNTENIGSPFVGVVVLHIFCALLSNIYQVTVYTHHYLHESFRTKTS